jgi:hypothetical protein
MKNTAAFIDAFCARQKPPLSAKEIANRMGLDPTVFPGWRRGESEHVRHDTLLNMQSALTHSPIEQARLLAEYLKDQCVGPGADLVEIKVRSSRPDASSRIAEDPARYAAITEQADDLEPYRGILSALREVKPDAKVRTALERLIRSLPGGKYLRKALLALAEMRED